jgi:hypothetical protein
MTMLAATACGWQRGRRDNDGSLRFAQRQARKFAAAAKNVSRRNLGLSEGPPASSSSTRTVERLRESTPISKRKQARELGAAIRLKQGGAPDHSNGANAGPCSARSRRQDRLPWLSHARLRPSSTAPSTCPPQGSAMPGRGGSSSCKHPRADERMLDRSSENWVRFEKMVCLPRVTVRRRRGLGAVGNRPQASCSSASRRSKTESRRRDAAKSQKRLASPSDSLAIRASSRSAMGGYALACGAKIECLG